MLVLAYSVLLVGATSWFWLTRNSHVQTGSTCFDPKVFCRPPEYMTADGIMYAHLSQTNEEMMLESIRDYYTANYRKTLPKKYQAKLASASTAEEKKKYEAILASLEKGIDVDTTFSAPRMYKGLDDVVAVITDVAAFVPSEGYVEQGSNFFFFRHEGASYRLAGVTPVGEDLRIYESAPVDMFKRGEAKL